MIKAVIFDLDGTLADTTKANALAYVKAFQEHGIKFSPKNYYPHLGKKWNQWGPKLAGSHAKAIHKLKTKLYSQMLDKVKPILNGISQWQKYKGKKTLVLATNASPECAQKVLKKFNLSFDYQFYGKDYPSSKIMFKKTIASLKIKPSEALLIDDSPERLKVATFLGMRVQAIKRNNQ